MRAIGIPLILTGIIILLLMRWKLGPVLLAGARIVFCSQRIFHPSERPQMGWNS
ncbi:MAG: hypothetical protein WAL86_12890 [Candidatus Acidiferrales bacterium]